MTDAVLERILDDLSRVPVLTEELIEAYADGRWLYERACCGCGIALDQRRLGCVSCQNRHEKRRQRGGREPAPLIGSPRRRS